MAGTESERQRTGMLKKENLKIYTGENDSSLKSNDFQMEVQQEEHNPDAEEHYIESHKNGEESPNNFIEMLKKEVEEQKNNMYLPIIKDTQAKEELFLSPREANEGKDTFQMFSKKKLEELSKSVFSYS